MPSESAAVGGYRLQLLAALCTIAPRLVTSRRPGMTAENAGFALAGEKL